MILTAVLSIEESREDVLLGVIVHSKVLGRSKHHHHHHYRHKRAHPPQHHHYTEKKSKIEVGIGNVTPPGIVESSKKQSTVVAAVTSSTSLSSSGVTQSMTLSSSGVTQSMTSSLSSSSSGVTQSMTSSTTASTIPSMYGSGENEVTSTSITHFSAGVKDDDNSDVAYSPSDEIEKTMDVPLTTKNSLPVKTEEFTAPLSPITVSRLQSLIQTVKDSIASLPPSSTAAAKQEDVSQPVVQPSTVEGDKNNAKDDNETTQSAYVFHETLPVTTSVAMATNLPVAQHHLPPTRQHSGFYGNQETYKPSQTPPLMYGDKRFDHQHGYQGQREQWIPYRSNWSPQRR